jgi:predicted naringenin-chalcone synthase
VSIGTAVPENEYQQTDLAKWMHHRLDAKNERMGRIFRALYQKTKIDVRYSVLPDFHKNHTTPTLFKTDEAEPKVEERLAIYNQTVLPLAEKAVNACLKNQDKNKITHLITVSCTGMSAPGIEIQLKQKLELKKNTQTHAVNFVGCYAFFPALKMADAFIQSNPKAKVLIVAVELCTLHFQNKDSEDHLLSNSLFSDGAAACLCSAEPGIGKTLKLKGTDQLLIPKGEGDMAWNIHSEGFLMKLSSYIPQLVEVGIKKLIKTLLEPSGMLQKDITHWAIHPGGRKILEVCEEELNLHKNELKASYSTLRNYGNMSAPTILFVLEEMLRTESLLIGERLFTCGFGPGLTLEAALFEIEINA